MKYCCDSNVLITAHNTYYPITMFPVFWDWLIERRGSIGSISWVYRELMDKVGGDDLSAWAADNKDSGFFRFDDDSDDVQLCFSEIANFVSGMTKPPEHKAQFLSKADPWIIAYASVNACTVVTLEERVPANSKKIKIPDICDVFGVKSTNTFGMLRAENARFPTGQ